jgi:hypothetical protein
MPAGWSLAQDGVSPRAKQGGDQLVQRPGQVVSGDQDNLLTGAEMVNRAAGYRVVGRRAARARAMSSSHGPASPDTAVSAIRCRMVPSGPIQVTTTLISSVCPLSRIPAGRRRRQRPARVPGRLHASLSAERVTVRAVCPVVSAAGFADRGRACPLRWMTQRHEHPVADERPSENIAWCDSELAHPAWLPTYRWSGLVCSHVLSWRVAG